VTLGSAFRIVASVAGLAPSPSPEGCHPVPNDPGVINCNFDRQEAQIIWTLDQLSYVFMAVIICILALAIYSLATGKSPIPTAVSRRLRRTPASLSDQRWLSAGVTIFSIATFVSLATMSLTYPGGFGHPEGPLYKSPLSLIGPASMLFGVAVGMTFLFRVRYLDRRTGTASSALDRLFGRTRDA
jgi:hypothetical protein